MYDQLARIARTEYDSIITSTQTVGRRAGTALKLRLHVVDGTPIDIWLSLDYERYSYHWEQRAKRGQIYRHDNAPDHPHISTHPKHCHNSDEETVKIATSLTAC